MYPATPAPYFFKNCQVTIPAPKPEPKPESAHVLPRCYCVLILQ